MALSTTLLYSTGIRNFKQNFGSEKQALEGGVLELWSGSGPASADDAPTGTKLIRYTLGGNAWTAGVRATFLLVPSGSAGSLNTLTVDGYSIISGAITLGADHTVNAAAIAADINDFSPHSVIKCSATSSGSTVTVQMALGLGTLLNAKTVAHTETTTTITINGGSSTTVGGAGATAGVAAVNGFDFGVSSSGILTLNGAYSGTVLATGIAGYARWIGPETDAYGSSTTAIRIQGICGTSDTSDFKMSTTSLKLGEVHSLNTSYVSLLESILS